MTINGLDLHHVLGVTSSDATEKAMDAAHYRFAEGSDGCCEDCKNERAEEYLTSECDIFNVRVMEKCTCDKFVLFK